tara:strand:- start:6 stop:260 length:255 start_codon:yes stop_codon:yes gene_type:complete
MAKEALYKKQKKDKEDKEMEIKMAGHFRDAVKLPYGPSMPQLIKIYKNYRKMGMSASKAYKETQIDLYGEILPSNHMEWQAGNR